MKKFLTVAIVLLIMVVPLMTVSAQELPNTPDTIYGVDRANFIFTVVMILIGLLFAFGAQIINTLIVKVSDALPQWAIEAGLSVGDRITDTWVEESDKSENTLDDAVTRYIDKRFDELIEALNPVEPDKQDISLVPTPTPPDAVG